ncbi:transcription initiation factor IIB [Nitrosopumilus sp.]|uniref:transcription initiation factor IIB n=1 Tax=Nitrosopumilus sp. TaxID=2024843 RepID=UPI00260B6070|nr:transcription initiation factor IIB [Nitrosopumilus sp.]
MTSSCSQKPFGCMHVSSVFDDVKGEMVCKNCGQVLEQNTIDLSHDGFSENVPNSRTGPRITNRIHDGGLSTVMGSSNYDASGNPVPLKLRKSYSRMRTWDSRSKTGSSGNKNLIVALNEMEKLRNKMALSDAIVERASYLYRKALEHNLVQGRSVRSMTGACIYASCRELETVRTLTDISKHLQEKKSSVSRSYRILSRSMDLDMPVADPVNSIIKFSNNLELPEKIKRDAIEIFNSLKKKKIIAGKKPDSVAAVTIYMACLLNNKEISQLRISRISGISNVTIRNRLKEFKKHVPLI